MNTWGFTIGGKHTYTDFGLYTQKVYIPLPDVKTQMVTVPFASGDLDLSEASGYRSYNDRKNITLEFRAVNLTDSYSAFWTLVKSIAAHIHGRKLKVIYDHDPNYYYMMRLALDESKTNAYTGTITLKGTAEPFKYALQASNEPWLWDTFSFIDGVIENTGDIEITATTKTLTIDFDGQPVCPDFIVTASTNLQIYYDGVYYSMPSAGKYHFPAVRIDDNHKVLTFTGTGALAVAYRRRYL